ncbi:glycosyltransferase [Candidatus Borrarchaeum sp.]|uniref:glycosyltransferase n=1 Tax=Candidatus Borrarchaeum sp. TaxID=2846742 RepID=UPI00257E43A4|nr:glycosyltransferase [Candidatus Borrarchaeum sp.]
MVTMKASEHKSTRRPLIYLAPCGIGLGHTARLITLAKKLRDIGASCFFSTNGDAVQFVKAHNFPVAEGPAILYSELPDGSPDFVRTTTRPISHIYALLKQIRREIQLIKRFNPDVIISDSRLSTVIAAWLLGRPCLLVLQQLKIIIPHITKLSKIRKILKKLLEYGLVAFLSVVWRRSQKIYIPDFPYPLTIAKSQMHVYSSFYNRVEFIGPIIDITPEMVFEDSSDLAIKSSYNLDNRPLIYCGLSGTIREKKVITEKLKVIFQSFPKTFQVFMTVGSENFKPIINDNVKVYGWVEKRTTLYRICDLVIHRGGHNTTSECIYFGKPMIIIPTPAHTEKMDNAQSIQKLGLGLVVSQSHLSRKLLLKAINILLNTPSFKNTANAIRKHALNFNAIQTIIEYIFSFYNGSG